MPLTGNDTSAGSVPLDAEEIAGPPPPRALAGQPEAEAACADAFPDRDGLDDRHVARAIAVPDLDDATGAQPCTLRP